MQSDGQQRLRSVMQRFAEREESRHHCEHGDRGVEVADGDVADRNGFVMVHRGTNKADFGRARAKHAQFVLDRLDASFELVRDEPHRM
jgi:hypothetical protein